MINTPMRIPAILTLLACVGCGSNTPDPIAPPPPPPPVETQATRDAAFVTAIRAQLSSAVQSEQFSGAVLVTRDGQTLFEGAYGLANREQNIPN